MQLPRLEGLNVKEKKVIVRADLDISPKGLRSTDYSNNLRLETLAPTLHYLLENKAKIIIIGHKGRPAFAGKLQRGKPGEIRDDSLSLKGVGEVLSSLLEKEVKFTGEIVGEKVNEEIKNLKTEEVLMLENLRFDKREEENNEEFAKILAGYGEVFVNESFGNSHREHASIIGIPKFLPHAVGFHFVKEVENLSRVLDNPTRPVVILISGVKADKLDYIKKFKAFADMILIGGRLPEYLPEDLKDPKLMVARLVPDKEDITIRSMEQFEKVILSAGTVVLSGPVSRFEDEAHMQGTRRIFEATASSKAFKIAGGGETEKAISMLGLKDQFDWISTGGGAMLEFFAEGTLPGIKALID